MMISDDKALPITRRGFATLGMVLLMCACAALSVKADDAVTMTIETEGAYTLVAGGSIRLLHELPAFYAIRKASEKAAEHFEQQGLIQFADRDKNELVNLVADSLSTELVEDQCIENGDTVTCRVWARTVVMLSDFIEAQLVSLRLGVQEDKEDYRHEMEPQVQVPLRPGLALAFRLSNQPDRMLEALRKACKLGSPTACAESM